MEKSTENVQDEEVKLGDEDKTVAEDNLKEEDAQVEDEK